MNDESKFEVGRTYWTRSAVDHSSVIQITVASRTAKTIVTIGGKRLRIKVWSGVETVAPYGKYSMSPVISADRVWPKEGEA